MKIYIYVNNQERFLNGEHEFCFRATTATPEELSRYSPGSTLISEVEVNTEPFEAIIRHTALAKIDAEKVEVSSRRGEEMAAIQERWRKLLAIEYKGE